jgi:hypothetical protein
MKANLLSFVFNNFCESGLFKGLRRKKIKQFLAGSTRFRGCAQRRFADTPLLSPGRIFAALSLSLQKHIRRSSGFVNELSGRCGPSTSVAPDRAMLGTLFVLC